MWLESQGSDNLKASDNRHKFLNQFGAYYDFFFGKLISFKFSEMVCYVPNTHPRRRKKIIQYY